MQTELRGGGGDLKEAGEGANVVFGEGIDRDVDGRALQRPARLEVRRNLVRVGARARTRVCVRESVQMGGERAPRRRVAE